MKFRKINDTTVNCIITQDDMKKHGIDLDDLFERKKNAVEFIRGIIVKAASTVNLNIKSDYTAMKISVLPDRSVSLTISQDPSESNRIREAKDASSDGSGHLAKDNERLSESVKNSVKPAEGIYVFRFSSFGDLIRCCRMLSALYDWGGSVYRVEETGLTYLILERGTKPDSRYDSIILKASEFGKMLTCDERTLAYMKEHCRCIIEKNAIPRISELYN